MTRRPRRSCSGTDERDRVPESTAAPEPVRGRRPPVLAVLALAGAVLGAAAPGQGLPDWLNPARVLVIYSTSFPDNNQNGTGDSLEVALAYQAARGVPAQNLLGVACSTTSDTYSGPGAWSAFYGEIVGPVITRLLTLGPLAIDTLLLCHGVPFRLALGGSIGPRSLDEVLRSPWFCNGPTVPAFPQYWFSSPYFEPSPGFGTNVGHFSHGYTFSGWFFLAARLDGLDVDAVLDLIEGSRYGDLYLSPLPGYYQGTIYVDTRFSTYSNLSLLPYPQLHGPSYANADQDLAWGTQWMFASGFPVRWENTAGDFEIGQPGAMFHTGAPALLAPNALFYYGWYNYATYRDVWDWLPGSAACDLNSNSIAGIRSVTPGSFEGTAFRRGLTCGVGCIDEPYLTGHPFPEVFVKYLLDGFTFAEAANVSDPAHAWVNLCVGDPLYCPMRSGKVPVLDTAPPPVPVVTAAGSTAAQASWRLRIDTTGRPPDLVTAGGVFGPAPRLDQVAPHQRPYRRVQTVALGGLAPGSFYRALLEVRDPAGLSAPAPELLFLNDGGSGLAARVQADAVVLGPGQPVAVEYALRAPGGFGTLTSLSFTLDVPGLGITGLDVTPLLVALPLTVHGNPLTGNLASLEVHIPPGLASGVYVLRLTATTASASVQDWLTLTVL